LISALDGKECLLYGRFILKERTPAPNRRLYGSQSQSGYLGAEKKIFARVQNRI